MRQQVQQRDVPCQPAIEVVQVEHLQGLERAKPSPSWAVWSVKHHVRLHQDVPLPPLPDAPSKVGVYEETEVPNHVRQRGRRRKVLCWPDEQLLKVEWQLMVYEQQKQLVPHAEVVDNVSHMSK